MKFNSDEIASVIQQEIEQFASQIDVRDVGRVLEVGDGIARVYGLSGVMAQEMVEFPNGTIGLAFNLEENSVGIIILGDYLQIAEGDEVRSTGRLLSVPVGDELLGRVVDPLGNPLDGKGPIVTKQRRPVEIIAPGVAERQPVSEPLQTGIKAIDAMTPIGRGQRELIIGDRKTGKTAIGIDAIINQRDSGVKCFYVAIGQKESTVAGVIEKLREHGRDGLHDRDRLRRQLPCPAAIRRPVLRHRDGRALHVRRPARPHRVRRPEQASRRLSPVVAAAAPPAGPRGVSRRRVLLPQPAARAVGEAVRRARRRLAHVAADHRNARRRSLGLHSDERDFDHRRPDLPAAGPVLRRRASRP